MIPPCCPRSISNIEDFLATPSRVLAMADAEAQEIASKHGTPRKTAINSEEVRACVCV